MTFEKWKKAVFVDVATIGFRKTAAKHGVSKGSIQNLVAQATAGNQAAGYKTWVSSQAKKAIK